MSFNLGSDLCTADSWGANVYLAVILDQQYVIKGNFRSFVVLQTIDKDQLVFLYFVLVPCYFYNCVHNIEL